MTRLAAPASRGPWTPSALRWRVRTLHQPRILWLNAGWIAIAAGIALSMLGLAAIATTHPDDAAKQSVFLVVALLAAAVVAAPHYQLFQRLSYPLLVLVLLLLVFVLIPIVPEVLVRPKNGARRWINLGVVDFQPSEVAKLAYVLALAHYLRARSTYRTLLGLLLPLVLTFIPLGLVLIEPDLGTSLLFLPTFFAMLVAAGAKLKHIAIIVTLGLALAPAMYPLLEPHQKDRIDAMIAQVMGDSRFDHDIGFQGDRAMTLVGAGGWTGVGKAKAAALVEHNSLPEEHNDMIFAVVCCRWGVLGAVAVWGSFLLLALGGVLVAAQAKDPFGRLIAVGVVAVLFTQMTINTGMTIGLLPITGMTLPFVSYGGSSLVATWMMASVLLNVGLRRPRYLARPSFEFDQQDDE